MVCPFYNRETEGGCTFKGRGAKLWNRIPLDTAGAFKNALKKTFFSLVLLGIMFLHFYILVYISLFLSYSIFNSLLIIIEI